MVKYGIIGKKMPIKIMSKATSSMKKRGELKKGTVAVQSLVSGETGFIKKAKIKNISEKYPKKEIEAFEKVRF